jgi:hypothetical protein
LIRVAVPQQTKAFDRHHKIWVGIPQGTELTSISARCTGWMNGLITGCAGWDEIYFGSGTWCFMAVATAFPIPLETCQRSSLMREFIVAVQQEELVQAFTNKAIGLIGKNGLDLYRPSFSKSRAV